MATFLSVFTVRLQKYSQEFSLAYMSKNDLFEEANVPMFGIYAIHSAEISMRTQTFYDLF